MFIFCKKELLSTILFSVFFFFSCDKTNFVDSILEEAESVIEIDPDRALSLLTSLSIFKLDEPQLANYSLLLIHAKDKKQESIENDSTIFLFIPYFEAECQDKQAAYSNYYAGKIEFQRNNLFSATEHFIKAKEYAKAIGDYSLLGFTSNYLGYMYQKELDIDQALEQYNLAQRCFEKAGDKKNVQYALGNIAYLFLMTEEEQADSALFYFRKVFDYAKLHNDTTKMSEMLKGIGLAYIEMGHFQLAKANILEAISLNAEAKFLFDNHSLLASVCLWNDEPDSAFFYAEKLYPCINEDKSSLQKHIYLSHLAGINEYIGNYEFASKNYELMNQCLEELFQENLRYSVDRVTEKYQTAKTQNDLNRATIHKQSLIIITLFAIFTCCGLVGTIYYIVKRKNKNIIDAEEKLENLKRILFNIENNDLLNSMLSQKIDIARKITQIEMLPNRDDKIFFAQYKEIFDEDLEKLLRWDNLFPIFQNRYKDLSDKLTSNYPNLSEKERQICYLIHAGFSLNEMAFLLSYTYDSVRVFKFNVRKRMGFVSNDEFMEFLKAK